MTWAVRDRVNHLRHTQICTYTKHNCTFNGSNGTEVQRPLLSVTAMKFRDLRSRCYSGTILSKVHCYTLLKLKVKYFLQNNFCFL
jgi:hypothetical protein